MICTPMERGMDCGVDVLESQETWLTRGCWLLLASTVVRRAPEAVGAILKLWLEPSCTVQQQTACGVSVMHAAGCLDRSEVPCDVHAQWVTSVLTCMDGRPLPRQAA